MSAKTKKVPTKAAKAAAKKGKPKSGKGLPATKKARDEAVVPEVSRKKRLEDLITSCNAKHADGRGAPVIMRASDANCSYLLRRPTGVIDLDIALGGGFPASAVSIIVGPEGVGKDHLLWKTCGKTQEIYGDEFAMAVYFTEFKPDKAQMRHAGLRIAYSEAEIAEFAAQRAELGQPPYTDEELAELRDQVGQIAIVAGVDAETGFDILGEFLESNTCQIIAVNSIGFLQTTAKEEKDSFKEFAQRSSEAILLTKVTPRFAMMMNRLGSSNETAIILINQVRGADAKRTMPGRQVQEKDKYQPAVKVHSMRHGMAIELSLHKGSPVLYDERSKEAGGREIYYELTKGKLGTHDGIKGKYTFLFSNGIQRAESLFAACLRYEVFEVSGSYYTFSHPTLGFRSANGQERVRYMIMNVDGLAEALEEACFKAAGVHFRWK